MTSFASNWLQATQGIHPVTMVASAALPLLTVEQGKLRAGLDWLDGDPRDDLMAAFIAAAQQKVETDVSLSLTTQGYELFYDSVTAVLVLPPQCRPVQTVSAIEVTDTLNAKSVLAPEDYFVDTIGGRILFNAMPAVTPRTIQAWHIALVSGYELAAVPPLLVQAVGLLVAHYATLGRDLASIDPVTEIPEGYAALIQAWRPEVLA